MSTPGTPYPPTSLSLCDFHGSQVAGGGYFILARRKRHWCRRRTLEVGSSQTALGATEYPFTPAADHPIDVTRPSNGRLEVCRGRRHFFLGFIADRKGFVYHPDYFVAKAMPPFMHNLFRQSSKTIQFIPPYFQFLLAVMSGFRTELLFFVATSAFQLSLGFWVIGSASPCRFGV